MEEGGDGADPCNLNVVGGGVQGGEGEGNEKGKVGEDVFLGFVERAEKSSRMLKDQAGSYSDAFEHLASELEGITKALGSVMESFSGPSMASQLMQEEDGGVSSGVSRAQAARRSLRGQRKPGSQLLWPRPRSSEEAPMLPGDEAGDQPMPEGMLSGSPRSTVVDASDKHLQQKETTAGLDEKEEGDLGSALPADTSCHGELFGSSILVEYAHGDALCSQVAQEDEKEEEEEEEEEEGLRGVKGGGSGGGSRPESGAASRAVTRPQTTVEQILVGAANIATKDEGEGTDKEMELKQQAESGEGEDGRCDTVPKGLDDETDDLGPRAKRRCSPDDVDDDVDAGHGGNGCLMSSQELEEYQASKGELASWIRQQGGVHSLEAKAIEGVCGLRNQGATCYMNSLLQALFQCPEFRQFVLSFEHDENRHGPPATCIPAQLQLLVASMSLSDSCSVSTDALTHSFGWGSTGAMQQHDVSELLHKLFDALERATDEFDQIRRLFFGKMINYIGCPEKSVWRCRSEDFLTMHLQVEGIDTLPGAISHYLAPETIDGDNMWRLDSGEMVHAVKGMWPLKLPGIMVMDLQRFKYDMSGRIKVNAAQSIDLVLDMRDKVDKCSPEKDGFMQEDGGGGGSIQWAGDGVYDLGAVLLHRGTAMGGHYCACVREWVGDGGAGGGGFGRWLLCDDDRVSLVEEDVLQSLLEGKDCPTWRNWNAYMLVYRDRGLPTTNPRALMPCGDIEQRIKEENKELSRLRHLYKVHQNVCEMEVWLGPEGREGKLQLVVSKETVMRDAVDMVRQRAIKDKATGVEFADKLRRKESVCRLKRYEALSPLMGETYGGRESQTLAQLSLSPSCHLLLEVREEADAPFAEHDDWAFKVSRWANGEHGKEGCRDVVVRNGVDATVSSLSCQVLSLLGIDETTPACVLVYSGERGRGCRIIWDSRRAMSEQELGAALLEQSGLERGGEIVVEQIQVVGEDNFKPGSDADADSVMSDALRHFEGLRYSATVSFNHPLSPDSFCNSVEADIRWSLGRLKEAMAAILSIEPGSVHLRRSAKSPQLRDEGKTLEALGISQGGSIFIGEGAPREEGQVLLKVCLMGDAERKDTLLQVTASEKTTCSQLKKLLVDRISKMKQPPRDFGQGPEDPARIRLRDKKGKEIGKILLDDLTLKRALPRLADGRELAAQILSAPETATGTEIILQLRFWDVGAQSLNNPSEIVVSKLATVEQLRLAVASTLPRLVDLQDPSQQDANQLGPESRVDAKDSTTESNVKLPRLGLANPSEAASPGLPRLGLAKASAFGPPLDIAGASRLKWEIFNGAGAAAISEAPCSLRDGSILVARDEWEFKLKGSHLPCTKGSSEKRVKGSRLGNASLARLVPSERSRPVERDLKISVWGEAKPSAAGPTVTSSYDHLGDMAPNSPQITGIPVSESGDDGKENRISSASYLDDSLVT